MKFINKLKSIFKKINDFIKKYEKYINVYVILIYLIGMLFIVFHHELWRDEVQAWCLARDLNIVELFKQMQYEGHPCLWHLILMPFAKLGFPVITTSLVSIAFMTTTVGIILYKAPFNYFVKLLLILSSPFIYFYSIHGRVYCIIPFIISLICLVYPKRKEKPYLYATLIAFLMNTHIMMAALVGILSLLFFIETMFNKEYDVNQKNKYLKAILIILLGIFICFAQINNSLFKNTIVENLQANDMTFIDKILLGISEETLYFTGRYVESDITLWIIFGLFIVSLIIGLFVSFKSSLIILCAYGFQFVVCSFIWFSNSQRVSMLIIYVMLATWLAYHNKNDKDKNSNKKYCIWQVILILISLVSIPNGYQNLKYDINEAVSGAEETAKYIETNLKDSKFICPVDYVATSLTGYIDENIFWSNVRKDYFTFEKWDYYWRLEIEYDEFIENIKDYVLANDEVYLIYSENFIWTYDDYIYEMISVGYIQLIYISPYGLNSESYEIYKFTDEFYQYIKNDNL